MALSRCAFAERLPLQAFSVKDGLAHDHINCIRSDSRGVLWFCTDEGLSQFDGSRFTTYSIDNGLPHPHINDLVETRAGVYWIATDAGLCRFNPKGVTRGSRDGATKASEPLFVLIPHNGRERSRFVNTLLEDNEGNIWCGTNDGLYRVEERSGQIHLREEGISFPAGLHHTLQVNTLLLDSNGILWAGAASGVYRREGGIWTRFGVENGIPGNFINRLKQDRTGAIWAGTREGGLCRLASRPQNGRPACDLVLTGKDGLPNKDVRDILHDAAGRFWVATVGGLSELRFGKGGRNPQFINYTTANGLTEPRIYKLAEDRQKNLWIGTNHAGVMRIPRDGFVTYSEADGLKLGSFSSIQETSAGELYIYSGDNDWRVINKFDGTKFRAVPLARPGRAAGFGYAWYQAAFQDAYGVWWLPTTKGVYRYPAVKRIEDLPGEQAIPLPGKNTPRHLVWRLYQDRNGDVWFAIFPDESHPHVRGLHRWERKTGVLHTARESPGLPLWRTGIHALLHDSSQTLWLGLHLSGEIVRSRSGAFELFGRAEGVPAGTVNAFHEDSSGRIWLATERGLARIDNPQAGRPQFTTYTTSNGLSSNEIWCITENLEGRIYVCTGKGVDRLDPATGRVKHYTTSHGLAAGNVRGAFRDRAGQLWFVTNLGVSRLIPQQEGSSIRPPVRIMSVRLRGQSRDLSQLGETRVDLPDLRGDQHPIEIDYAGVDMDAGANLHYQYRLSDSEWSKPTRERTVIYGKLTPGAYTFQVRAINEEGLGSPDVAEVRLHILAPVWRRAWFLGLCGLAILLLAYAGHRLHLRSKLAFERVRSRIATDLHDDLGSSLARVAILSEVLAQTLDGKDERSRRMVLEIGGTARRLVDGMRDIVWSIDPRHDSLEDVIRRIREFASDVLEAKGINCTLETTPDARNLKISPEQRRHIYLIFKEAINNIAAHSRATHAVLRLAVVKQGLCCEVRDDGAGVLREESGGHGLGNMRVRASQAGGTIEIVSKPGQGTQIVFCLPLRTNA